MGPQTDIERAQVVMDTAAKRLRAIDCSVPALTEILEETAEAFEQASDRLGARQARRADHLGVASAPAGR